MKKSPDITVNPLGAAFYTSAYHYRRTSVLVVGIGLLLICGSLFCRAVWELVKASDVPSNILIGLFPLSILGFFTFVGALFLRYYLTDHTLALVIDREGVRYGGRFYPWQDIGSLQGRSSESTIQLLLHRRGRIAMDRHLMTNDGMEYSEFNALMMKLQAQVAPLHDHLDFG
jgi:hypothetical protein